MCLYTVCKVFFFCSWFFFFIIILRQFQINLEILILNVAPIIKRINKYQIYETKPHHKT